MRLSVVMPVRNAMPYLDEAIESILAQTHSDFEFIIVDDGSNDGSAERAAEWGGRDHRIRFFASDRDHGPVSSANLATSLARESIVARMDADDIAHPERLALQLKVMIDHPDVVLVGCNWEGIDASGERVRPADASVLRSRRLSAPFCHGSILFRREAFERIGGYRQACNFWEDTDFYFRLATQGRILVLPDVLHRYRFSSSSARLHAQMEEVEMAIDCYLRCSNAATARGSYEQAISVVRRERVSMGVFAALSALQIWAGGRPRLLQRSMSRGRIPRSAFELGCLLYVALAHTAPRGLRWALVRLLEQRQRCAEEHFKPGEPVEWYWSRTTLKRNHSASVAVNVAAK